ncbi:MAG: DUF1592 domain-containing protein [Isosphaeraceae bacterium]
MPRRRFLPVFLLFDALTLPAFAVDLPKPQAPTESSSKPAKAASFSADVAPFLKKYCVDCHGGAKPKADLNLASYDGEESVLRGRKVWARVAEQVELGEMPPENKPQPHEDESAAFAAWVKSALAKVDCSSQTDPGRVTIRRLNRTEYNNTVRDLVGVDFHPADDFPSDDVGYGFDNIGDVLTLPPLLFEKYLDAAETIAERAIVAGPGPRPGSVKTYEAEKLPPMPGVSPHDDDAVVLPSVARLLVQHDAPREAEYRVRVRAYGEQAGPEPVKLAFVVDGKQGPPVVVKAVADEPQVFEHKGRLKKGAHSLGVAFLNDYYNDKASDPKQRDRNLVVDWVSVEGPLFAAGDELPASHRKVIFKTPAKGEETKVADELVGQLARRAYRRPVTPGEVARLVRFVDLARENGESFERGMQLALQAILVSPQFLFRVELDRGPRRDRRGRTLGPAPIGFPINDFELASRLSYFLWSSMPDDELFQLARRQAPRGETLEKQVRRMLRDPKASALVENFAGQWLQIRNLKTINPDRGTYPNFDESLRTAMIRETELFFGSIIQDDRSVFDLIDSDDTFVNERLARHYGIKGVKGDQFRRVKLTDGVRGGVLTQASVLTVTSNPTRTSPVKRGKWILEQILGTPPPPPPGEVPELQDDAKGRLTGSLRQRMEQHRANPNCATCHARMDPLGFGFENFDGIGAWREKDGNFPVDPSGVLPNGKTFQGPKELKAILKARQKDFVRCLAEKMLTYATGRGVEYYDACAVDRIVEGTVSDGGRFSKLVLEIVQSDPFQKRKGRGDSR